MARDLKFQRFLRDLEKCDKFVEQLLKMPEGPAFDAALAKYEAMVAAL